MVVGCRGLAFCRRRCLLIYLDQVMLLEVTDLYAFKVGVFLLRKLEDLFREPMEDSIKFLKEVTRVAFWGLWLCLCRVRWVFLLLLLDWLLHKVFLWLLDRLLMEFKVLWLLQGNMLKLGGPLNQQPNGENPFWGNRRERVSQLINEVEVPREVQPPVVAAASGPEVPAVEPQLRNDDAVRGGLVTTPVAVPVVHPQRAQDDGPVRAANGLSHQDLLELEALRMRALHDAEAQFVRDLVRRRDASSSASFQTVAGLNGNGNVNGNGGSGGGGPLGVTTPQGQPAPGTRPGTGPVQASPMMTTGGFNVAPPVGSVGEALNESLRSLELPKISMIGPLLNLGIGWRL